MKNMGRGRGYYCRSKEREEKESNRICLATVLDNYTGHSRPDVDNYPEKMNSCNFFTTELTSKERNRIIEEDNKIKMIEKEMKKGTKSNYIHIRYNNDFY
jgi:hypothetical protein